MRIPPRRAGGPVLNAATAPRPAAGASAAAYDCIVVGAGMSGLTFAAMAAKAKRRVLVVDRHYLPGGCFTAFKRFDEDRAPYVFNVAMEWTTDGGAGEPFRHLIDQLDLGAEYGFRKLRHFRSIRSPELGTQLDLPCDAGEFREALARAFPAQRAGVERFVDDCLAVATHAPRSTGILFRSGVKSVEATLADYFDDPVLIQVLYGLLDYPSARGVLLMFLVGSICTGNVYMPVHGDQRRLASLMHRKIRKCGGKLLYSTSVEEILVAGDQAYGVRLATGEEMHAPLVVACTDTVQLYDKLLNGRYSATGQAGRALSRAPGASSFALFLKVDGPLPEAIADNHSWLLLAPAAQWKADRAAFANAPLRVDFQSALYPELAPPGKATACVRVASDIADYDHWGQSADCDDAAMDRERYERAKSLAARTLLERMHAAFPELEGRLHAMDAATPFTIRRYTHNHKGAIGAGLNDLRSIAQASTATPVGGVHHVGHWTVASGVNSVMYSAFTLYQSLFGGAPSRAVDTSPQEKAETHK